MKPSIDWDALKKATSNNKPVAAKEEKFTYENYSTKEERLIRVSDLFKVTKYYDETLYVFQLYYKDNEYFYMKYSANEMIRDLLEKGEDHSFSIEAFQAYIRYQRNKKLNIKISSFDDLRVSILGRSKNESSFEVKNNSVLLEINRITYVLKKDLCNNMVLYLGEKIISYSSEEIIQLLGYFDNKSQIIGAFSDLKRCELTLERLIDVVGYGENKFFFQNIYNNSKFWNDVKADYYIGDKVERFLYDNEDLAIDSVKYYMTVLMELSKNIDLEVIAILAEANNNHITVGVKTDTLEISLDNVHFTLHMREKVKSFETVEYEINGNRHRKDVSEYNKLLEQIALVCNPSDLILSFLIQIEEPEVKQNTFDKKRHVQESSYREDKIFKTNLNEYDNFGNTGFNSAQRYACPSCGRILPYFERFCNCLSTKRRNPHGPRPSFDGYAIGNNGR